jgi:hypothetical protein
MFSPIHLVLVSNESSLKELSNGMLFIWSRHSQHFYSILAGSCTGCTGKFIKREADGVSLSNFFTASRMIARRVIQITLVKKGFGEKKVPSCGTQWALNLLSLKLSACGKKL